MKWKKNMTVNIVNNLSRKVELTATKRLMKDLVNGHYIYNGTKYFSEDDSKNHFVFQPLYWKYTTLANNMTVTGWISQGLSNSIIKLPATSDHSLDP